MSVKKTKFAYMNLYLSEQKLLLCPLTEINLVEFDINHFCEIVSKTTEF